MSSNQTPNKLIEATSPYLLQHAYNPVQWYPWGAEALDKAQKEDKPIIVSIGYSACHWCHVMERESFEDDQIADIMNAHYVCIKVDREERPDIDQIYMDAIQAMGINGGWPLNVFTTPDQKPFYGGTYFPSRNWAQMLINVADAYRNHKDKLQESANSFAKTVAISELQRYNMSEGRHQPELGNLKKMIARLQTKFDNEMGGIKKAPKFPMPSIWHALLRSNAALKDPVLADQLELTLDGMASGGIYDQVGGGFSRYSVDAQWFAPHFEKMLYDNGQLLSLYSDAWRVYGKVRYREVIYETIDFMERELFDASGGFYAALDADSEGEEGKFYVWTYDEFCLLAGDDAQWLTQYYHVTPQGNWEKGWNILHSNIQNTDEEYASTLGLSLDVFKDKLQKFKQLLLKVRSKRVRPSLDDKILAGWNGMALKGLADAYAAFGDQRFLELARKNAAFILTKLIHDDVLYRNYKNEKISIKGCLEDYAFVIQGFIALCQVTFDEQYLQYADKLCKYVIAHFHDSSDGYFFFTDANAEKLIARKKEIFDNVIPASNSAMAINLYQLGKLLANDQYIHLAEEMLGNISGMLSTDLQYLGNWSNLYLYTCYPTAEIAMVGPRAEEIRMELERYWLPNKVVAGALSDSQLPLLQNRQPADGSTKIYVCYDKSCKLPVDNVQSAIDQLILPN
ncbi:MAG: thioredoxin domain-containing protein [Cyclobacteriaceae bacterium]